VVVKVGVEDRSAGVHVYPARVVELSLPGAVAANGGEPGAVGREALDVAPAIIDHEDVSCRTDSHIEWTQELAVGRPEPTPLPHEGPSGVNCWIRSLTVSAT